MPSLRGAPLLLVEDEAINQAVAREMLESIGLRVVTVDNGAAAVDAVTCGGVVIVLMDMHMPVMDGPQATRHIRQLDAVSTIPIIAMTAGSQDEDFYCCLVAGADECIAKPLRRESLVDALNRRIPPGDYKPLSSLPVSEVDKRKYPYLPAESDAEGIIDLQRGLRQLSGNRRLYALMLKQLAERHSKSSDSVAERVKSSQFSDALDLLHTIKGVAGNLGALLLYQSAVAFEHELKGARQADKLAQLQGEYDAAVEATLALIRSSDTLVDDEAHETDPQSVPIDVILKRIEQLEMMAENYEYIGSEVVAEIISPCRHRVEPALLMQLQQTVADLDHDSLVIIAGQIRDKLVAGKKEGITSDNFR
ncbi:MAG: response regulator [Sedimenticola sp.]